MISRRLTLGLLAAAISTPLRATTRPGCRSPLADMRLLRSVGQLPSPRGLSGDDCQ